MATQGCPCGHLGDPVHACRCAPVAVERYHARISGPLLDRIDIHLSVPAVPYAELSASAEAEPSAAVRARVEAARQRQRERFRKEPGVRANAHMSVTEHSNAATEEHLKSGQAGGVGSVVGWATRAQARGAAGRRC